MLIAPHLLGGAETCLPTSGTSQILGKTSSFEAMSFAFEPSRKWNQFASQIAAAISGACKVLEIAQVFAALCLHLFLSLGSIFWVCF